MAVSEMYETYDNLSEMVIFYSRPVLSEAMLYNEGNVPYLSQYNNHEPHGC